MPSSRQRVAVIGMSFVVVLFVVAGRLVGSEETREQTYEDLVTFTEVLQLVNSSYVDPVEDDRLMNGAFRGMLASLDPQSGWLSPDEVRAILDDESGRLHAGIETTKRGGYSYVVAVRGGSPAEQAGVESGDYIRTINGQSTREMSIFQVRRVLTGKPSSRLHLNLFGGGEGREVDIRLQPYDSEPLVVSERDDGVLLVQLNYLEAETVTALGEVLRSAPAATSRVLLDLRDTVGGRREVGTALADLFLEEGVIVEINERGKDPQAFSAEPETAWAGPLYLLVNRMSAGAAEIAAAALKDNQRAPILGERTFGDASVQRLIQLPDESAVILSVGRYVGPGGASWADDGVEPDVEIPATASLETDVDVAEAAPEEDADAADEQLERALEYVAGEDDSVKQAA